MPHLQVRCVVRLLRQLENVIQLRRGSAGRCVPAMRTFRSRTAGAVICHFTACPRATAPLIVLLDCALYWKEQLPDAWQLSRGLWQSARCYDRHMAGRLRQLIELLLNGLKPRRKLVDGIWEPDTTCAVSPVYALGACREVGYWQTGHLSPRQRER